MDEPMLVLLAEDEVLIRMNLQEELTEAGFELAVTTNGQQAMAELEAEAGRLGAVVTDIRLGRGPDGWGIARRARELVPAMPVVYISGDSAHEWSARGVLGSVMVPKPFYPAEVVAVLLRLLSQAGKLEGSARP